MNADLRAQRQRPEIANAWKRATLLGLDPGMPVRETGFSPDFDRHSRLSTAAQPILDRMMDELADTRFSVLLTDRTARIIDRRAAQRQLNTALDDVLAAPGFQYLEQSTGTNALATAYELRQPISVTGDEHFLELLKQFCCHGAPITHPITRRVEGVLDITGPVDQSTTLLGPFLMRAVHDIEQRLLEGARMSEQRLLAAFQTHTRNRNHAVLVYGENVMLSNSAAMDLIQTSDHAALRDIAADVVESHPVQRRLTLSSGSSVLVTARSVSDTAGGVIFDIRPVREQSPSSVEYQRPEGSSSTVAQRIELVIGEPGTGRTTVARRIAGENAVFFDALDADLDDSWALRVRNTLRQSPSVVIDNIHVLERGAAARLTPAVRTAAGLVVMTTSPLSTPDPELAALAAEALARRELRPVRAYQQDFNALALEILRAVEPNSSRGITPTALTALAAHPWPGNLRELQSVLDYATTARPVGAITANDLPPAYRSPATRRLTPIETAERDAIISALRAAHGNKAAAAAELGIGRTTLYARLHRYRITG
ncbi:sigma-54-dependent Fis family transcriptional regulator [Nocardia africana]|nr:helix-turn-helix domain-containing protein [Nocardia africana]MCC3312911.1 Fis family transcriptional regulator [Nocardia africana]